MSLPTYEEATAKPDPWVIVAPGIPTNALANLCLVSKSFFDIFMPLLWFEPTEILLNKKKPFLAYDQFARKVWKARRYVRSHVIALDFRKLGPVNFLAPELDLELTMRGREGNLIFEWFGALGLCFPALKFFLVDGTGENKSIKRLCKEIAEAPFPIETFSPDRGGGFGDGIGGIVEEHHEMVAAGPERGDSVSSESTFRPILLHAIGCSQIFIPMFISAGDTATNLLYLDISWTKQKPDDMLILATPPHLKILKMRGLALRTRDIASLMYKMKLRLFSLDLSYNELTNEVIGLLLESNVLPPLAQRHEGAEVEPANHPGRYLEDAPAYRERADPSEEQENAVAEGRIQLRADDVGGVFEHLLENEHMKIIRGPHWLPPAEDSMMQQTGLTHIYLSNNRLTAHALKELLLGTNRLQLVDFGSAEQSNSWVGSKYKSVLVYDQADALKLLKPQVSQRLESLRVHHSVVTQTPTIFALGDFYLSEARAIFMAEEEFSNKTINFTPTSEYLPEINPRIKSLTLTHVPRKSLGLVIERLIKLLSLAALQEVTIAKASPPETRRGAQMLSGLRHLCLEFAPLPKILKPSKDGPSVSGDVDADAFMEESGKDFSFFDETQYSPQAAMKDFSFFEGENYLERTPSGPSYSIRERLMIENLELYDVKEAIVTFRGRTKATFEAAKEASRVAGGLVPPGLPTTHWTGQLEFVDESHSQATDVKKRLLDAIGGGEPVKKYHPWLL